jgi:hypothetical protein
MLPTTTASLCRVPNDMAGALNDKSRAERQDDKAARDGATRVACAYDLFVRCRKK